MMQRDPLTNAYTRAALQSSLPREVERADETGTPLSLCMLDLDYFKSINDAYGHLRGDQVLQELVERLSGRLRGEDYLYRYGGDEFVVVLPQTSLADAIAVAHRLHTTVVEAPFEGTPPLWLSVSVGVATYPADADTIDTLFEEADHRLYMAKRAGRNQVVGDRDPPSSDFAVESPSRLIERDDAVAQFHQFLSDVLSVGRGIVAITGPHGSGRTELLAVAEQAATLRGFAVLKVDRSHTDATTDGEPDKTGDSRPEAESIVDLDTLVDSFRRLRPGTGKLGLMIAVDDLDSFPAHSIERLRHSLRETTLPSVLLAYTAISDVPALTASSQIPHETIALTPLSPTGVQVWLRGLLRIEPPSSFVQWVYEETKGQPDKVQQLLTSLIARGSLQPVATGGWSIADGADFPTHKPVIGVGKHNLLNPLTEVIGRDDEVRAVREMLARQRLVTLVGPGGIGKTRLALQVARESLADFADGVWFVPLGSIEDPELVGSTIAQALGIIEVPGQSPVSRLLETLARQERLLVLDNFEQVVDAAPIVSELLQSAPRLKALVTSRERLRIYGEHLYSVPPLALPDLDRLPEPDELALTESVALFIARTRAVRSEFGLTATNARTVAEICARLDGLPLALELAAARSDEFTVDELLLQLNDALSLLTGGPRDLPQRQQTLRAAIDWSVNRLTEDDQRLFAELAVFAGGWTVEASSSVVQGSFSSGDLAVRLNRLVDKHLIEQVRQSQTPRFEMLETLRAFGVDLLQNIGELDFVRRTHARYFETLAETAEPEMRHGAQREWLDRLETEHHNLRSALRWALGHNEDEIAGRLGAAIWRFWSVRGHVSEGRRWLKELRDRGDRVPHRSRVHVLIGSGVMAWIQGDYEVANAHFNDSLRLCTEHEILPARAMTLNNLGLVARQRADYEGARRYFEASLELWRELRDPWGMANVLGNLGRMAQLQGDGERARELTEESIALRRDMGDRYGLTIELHTLGLAELDRGEFYRAAQLFKEALQHARDLNDPRLIAMALTGLGRLEQTRERWPEARQHYLEALDRWQELEHKEGIAESLEGIASVLAATSAPHHAARLYGAADKLRRQVGAPVPPSAIAWHRHQVNTTRAELSEQEWDRAWNSGARLTLNDAIAAARWAVEAV